MVSKKRIKPFLIAFICIVVVALTYANMLIKSYREYTTQSVADLTPQYACLVLGTSKILANGYANLFYKYRIKAAAEVYSAGRCRKIIVSGDNRRSDYNEPEEMKASLISMGIPESDIHCDYAGGRTLDSVVRFNAIFGQGSGIVISQQFHNERAIYIARHRGINLYGYNAQEVDIYNALKTKIREVFSRMLAVLDVVVLNSQPRHYGEKIQI
jgi:SanA protein